MENELTKNIDKYLGYLEFNCRLFEHKDIVFEDGIYKQVLNEYYIIEGDKDKLIFQQWHRLNFDESILYHCEIELKNLLYANGNGSDRAERSLGLKIERLTDRHNNIAIQNSILSRLLNLSGKDKIEYNNSLSEKEMRIIDAFNELRYNLDHNYPNLNLGKEKSPDYLRCTTI